MGENLEKVALVIPVYNRRDTTLQGLRSLSRIDSGGFDVRIFVVDDASEDGTADAVRREFPKVVLIEGSGDLHYAGGTNRGIEKALEWEADYVVTMNDDSIFHEDFLQSLIRTARANPRSIVGSLLLLWDEPHRAFQVGARWDTAAGGWVLPEDLTAFNVPPEPFEVEGLVGNCVLLPAEAIRENGIMDEERFAHGWGDAQYFRRMHHAGWQLLVDPRSRVWCEPNTYPKALHTLSVSQRLKILFADERHPLNLKRQFDARWHSAPSKTKAVLGFAVYLMSLVGKSAKFATSRT